MEKERSTKIIAVVALVAAVLGLTIGFAAYSRREWSLRSWWLPQQGQADTSALPR